MHVTCRSFGPRFLTQHLVGLLLYAPALAGCQKGDAPEQDENPGKDDMPDQDEPVPVCGENLYTDASSCANGVVDIGEFCLEASGSLPLSVYMYPHNNIALADFNGDGHIDLRVGADIYAGNGDGTFAEVYVRPGPSIGIAGTKGVADCAEGDFNGDSIMDLAYVSYRIDESEKTSVRALNVWFGNESLDPSLGDWFWEDDYHYPTRVLPADFNGDGVSDLAVSFVQSDIPLCNVHILIRTGDTFVTASTVDGIGWDFDCPTNAAIDFDGDGHVDIDPGGNLLFMGDGTGQFKPKPSDLRPLSGTASYGHDLDCDNIPDAVHRHGAFVEALKGLPDARYEVADPDISSGETVVAVATLNKDIEPDILLAGPSGLRLLLGGAAFTFASPLILSPDSTFTELETADINGDGQDDVAALGASGVSIFLSHP